MLTYNQGTTTPLTCHAPLLFRLISLCSVNTEAQERTFGQLKQITKATSNNHPNNVITNMLVCLHEEGKGKNVITIENQESEINKLASTICTKENTVVPFDWYSKHSLQHQTHLERISDFLLPGHGVWWQRVGGIEFFDGGNCPNYHSEGPVPLHYRSLSLADVDLYLQQKWEECINKNVELPALVIRHYTSEGELSQMIHYEQPLTNQDVRTEGDWCSFG